MSEFIGNFHFLRPGWLLAFPVIAILAWLRQVAGDPARSLKGVIAPHLLPHLVIAPGRAGRLTPFTALLVLLSASALALAGPSWRMERAPFAEDQAVTMIVLKVTDSMASDDLLPSRLDRARHKIHDLLALRPGARAGLVAYSGSAHLVVPPTADHRVVEQFAQALSPGVFPVDGDALLDAFALAGERLDADGGAGSLVVIADAVDAATRSRLGENPPDYRVQFLAAVEGATAAARNGVVDAARLLKAPYEVLAADDSDVVVIDRRAARATVSAAGEGGRWRDAGYVLVPFIAAGLLLWSVRGFSVGWD